MVLKQEVSAGGVVFKKDNLDSSNRVTFQVLICKHSGYHKWVLPKGLVEDGENLQSAALREVCEEVGVKAKVVCPITGPETYSYSLNGLLISKTVHYFLMEYLDGDISDHDFEMEDVKWAEFAEAVEEIEFEGAKKTIMKAKELLSSLYH